MENSESRAGAELILNSQGKKKGMRKKCFLLGQLTACCCSTLPEAMQPQLHHLHWKGAREEGAAERATPPGSSPVMAVPGCEFTSTPFPDPISCSQALTLLNCFFVFVFFFMCPLPCCLNDFFAHRFWYPTPFQCIAYSLNSWGTAPWAAAWWSATHNGGIRHEE